jgi:DNA-binding MarR family transcriptional regulator
MSLSIRKIAATGAVAVLLGGAGLGAAQASTQSTASASSGTAATGADGKPRGGPSTAQLEAIAAKLGVTTAQLKAAMDANRPERPSGAKRDRGAGMAADLAKALGVDASKISAILEANRPARPAEGTRPAKPDQSRLVTALASGLGIDEATVKSALTKLAAAHKADHGARHTAMATAIAASLDLEASDVKAAFEAARPAPPTA